MHEWGRRGSRPSKNKTDDRYPIHDATKSMIFIDSMIIKNSMIFINSMIYTETMIFR